MRPPGTRCLAIFKGRHVGCHACMASWRTGPLMARGKDQGLTGTEMSHRRGTNQLTKWSACAISIHLWGLQVSLFGIFWGSIDEQMRKHGASDLRRLKSQISLKGNGIPKWNFGVGSVWAICTCKLEVRCTIGLMVPSKFDCHCAASLNIQKSCVAHIMHLNFWKQSSKQQHHVYQISSCASVFFSPWLPYTKPRKQAGNQHGEG